MCIRDRLHAGAEFFGIDNPEGPAQQLTIALEPSDLLIAAVAERSRSFTDRSYVRLVILQGLLRAGRCIIHEDMERWSTRKFVRVASYHELQRFPIFQSRTEKIPLLLDPNLELAAPPLDAKSEAVPARGQLRIKGYRVIH